MTPSQPVQSALAVLEKWSRSDHVRLCAGEMTEQEMRSVLAVIGGIKAEIARLPSPDPRAVRDAALERALVAANAYLQEILFFLKDTRPDEDPGPSCEKAAFAWGNTMQALRSTPAPAPASDALVEEIATMIDPSISDVSGPAVYVASRKATALTKARAILSKLNASDTRNAAFPVKP